MRGDVAGSGTAFVSVNDVDLVRIVPVVDTRYSPYDLPAAFDQSDPAAFGKIVIDVTR